MKDNEFNRFKKIVNEFQVKETVKEISYPTTNGNINNTYVVTCEKPSGRKTKYILQEINTKIFTEPYRLMENIEKITNYIEFNYPNQEIIKPVKRKNPDIKSDCLYKDKNSKYWRMYNFINNSISYNAPIDLGIIKDAGVGLAKFHKALSNFPHHTLHETISDFHNTFKRFKDFIAATRNNPYDRVQTCHDEIVELLNHYNDYTLILNLIESKKIPLRVVHNDTKINNILFDKDSKEFRCVIDLDTVMSGSLLYDIADIIRSGAATSPDDETDLSKVNIDLDLVKSFLNGYLCIMKDELTSEEINNIPNAIKISALELAIRYLTDYINGDIYFKVNINNPKQNLERAKNQIKLAKEIESKIPEISQIIDEIIYSKNLLK